MDRWKNKVAIITGASSGIGAAIAKKLIEKEIIVVGLARGKEKLDDLAKYLNNDKRFYPYVADVTKEEDILNAFNWTITNLGPICILINSAGIFRFASLVEGKTSDWKDVLDTNVMGLCIATREAINNMRKNNIDGHIIHINSVGGHTIIPDSRIYAASKHAVTALTETLRQELNSIGSKIKITSISPGYVTTSIFMTALSKLDVGLPENSAVEPQAALHPDDVAEGILYILGTPPHVQVHELTLKPIGEPY